MNAVCTSKATLEDEELKGNHQPCLNRRCPLPALPPQKGKRVNNLRDLAGFEFRQSPELHLPQHLSKRLLRFVALRVACVRTQCVESLQALSY
jgi:hypothetical protein